MAELWAIGLVVLATFLNAVSPIFLKRSSSRISFKRPSSLLDPDLSAGIALYALSTIIFIPALKGGELSVLYPIISLTYIWVSLLSIKYLKERMSTYRWIGIFLIMIGVIFIGVGI